MIKFSPQKQKFIDSATDMFGAGSVINKQQVRDASTNAKTLSRPLLNKFIAMVA